MERRADRVPSSRICKRRKRGELAEGRHPENSAVFRHAASLGRSEELAIQPDDQTCSRAGARHSPRLAAEARQDQIRRRTGIDFKQSPLPVHATARRAAVKKTIARREQLPCGECAVRACKLTDRSEAPAPSAELENRADIIRAACLGGAEKRRTHERHAAHWTAPFSRSGDAGELREGRPTPRRAHAENGAKFVRPAPLRSAVKRRTAHR